MMMLLGASASDTSRGDGLEDSERRSRSAHDPVAGRMTRDPWRESFTADSGEGAAMARMREKGQSLWRSLKGKKQVQFMMLSTMLMVPAALAIVSVLQQSPSVVAVSFDEDL